MQSSKISIRTFGRLKGRPLRSGQQKELAQATKHYVIPQVAWQEPEKNLLQRYFVNQNKIILEIGFGAGEHLLGQARKNPESLFIGIEPFESGFARAVIGAAREALSNCFFVNGDARAFIEALPRESLDEIFVLFPDPWPKKRHVKRRLLQPAFIHDLSAALKSGGRLKLASDIPSYIDFALFNILQSGFFDWSVASATDFRTPFEGHIQTRYESKALAAERFPAYLTFTKKG